MTSERAIIFSFSDCTHYLAGTTCEPEGMSEQVKLMRNDEGKVRKFPSAYSAQQALKQVGFSKAWMVMQSPYDEMIGAGAAPKTELPITFASD